MTHAVQRLAIRRLAGAALILCGCLTAASAQNAAGREPPPVAEPGTTGQSACIAENDGWIRQGRGIAFSVALTNKCEQRLQCRVFAYVTSAKGAAQGHGTLLLAPKSKGQAATQRWSMKVKMSSGSSQSARECRVF